MALAVSAVPAQAGEALPSAAAFSQTTIRYGPFTIPGGAGHEDPGMIENRLLLGVAKPCTGCFITQMAPTLVYPDGSRANMNTGAMLHHAVLSSQFRPDPTCATNLLGIIGQRFFATGNERTVIEFAPGYGYFLPPLLERWNMIVDLMNMMEEPQTVYIQITFTHTRSLLKPVTPVWLDIDQCGDSEYAIPDGFSDSHWDWRVNVPGKIVGIGGHMHDHGQFMEATNESTGQSICRSVARYNETPDYDDGVHPHVSSMSRCIADPVATVSRGQTVRIHAEYIAHGADPGAMGIMIAYIA